MLLFERINLVLNLLHTPKAQCRLLQIDLARPQGRRQFPSMGPSTGCMCLATTFIRKTAAGLNHFPRHYFALNQKNRAILMHSKFKPVVSS
jgi:hypothetical protein